MLLGVEESEPRVLGSLGENSLYLFGTHSYYLENEGVEKEPLRTLLPILHRGPWMFVEVFLSQKLGTGETRPELKKGGIWKTCEQLQPCFMKRHLSSIRTGRWGQFSKDPPHPKK